MTITFRGDHTIFSFSQNDLFQVIVFSMIELLSYFNMHGGLVQVRSTRYNFFKNSVPVRFQFMLIFFFLMGESARERVVKDERALSQAYRPTSSSLRV